MFKNSFLQPIVLVLIAVFFASCDKDFNELGTDIVGEDHFGFDRYTGATIIARNQKLGPIATNNLPINALGFYNNPAFGTTQANFVTQLELASTNPTFNNTDTEEYDTLPTVLDSVVMEIPYFARIPRNATITDNVKPYVLDSIYGATPYNQTAATENSKFKLSVYQSNYFLRDLDPNESFTQQQAFYNDENNTIDSQKIPVLLNDAPAIAENLDQHENNKFYFDKREHRTSVKKDDVITYARSVPSMRLHLNKTVFSNAILTTASSNLADNVTFKNYFRGIYFKVENGNPGNMALMNFKGGKITLYYNEDKKKTTTPVTFERVNKTFVLNMTGNSISLLQNSNENANYLTAANDTSEASKLYLKGGEGSIGIVDLFGTSDTYKYVLKVNGSGNPVDEKGDLIPLDADQNPQTGYYFTYTKQAVANGVSDELDDIRYPKYTTFNTVDYFSKKNRWLVNEANLIFNVVTNDIISPDAIEPNRIFLYDLNNKKVLVDYTRDQSTNSLFTKFNKGVFGGILLDQDGKILKQKNDANVYAFKGTRYKIRITNHIRDLIKNDSTNVRLGICVTESIANVGFSKLRTANTIAIGSPTSSVMNPLGTILYGTQPSVPDDKKLKLEVYYTKPN